MITHKEQASISKHWLNRGIGSHRYVKALQRRLDSFTYANITNYENDGSARTEPRENSQESKMLEYSELCRLIDETRGKIEAYNVETLKTINKIDSNLQKTILVERYINLLSWDDIAKKVDYSRAHVQRIHGVALLSLYEIIKQEGEA